MEFFGSTLTSFFLMTCGLIAIAAFDFYAYSPRPSGVAMRSRESAPIFIILLSLVAAVLSLKMYSADVFEQLVEHGANYAPRAMSTERARLISYVFVSTNRFESVLLALSLVTSAVFLGRFGMLGWVLVTLGTIAGTGLAANVMNPVGTSRGPFEVSVALIAASVLCFVVEFRSEILKSNYRILFMPVSVLVVEATGSVLLCFLKTSPPHALLVLAACLISIFVICWFLVIQRYSGPHWESSSLFFVSAIAGFVAIGFFLTCIATPGFDLLRWRDERVAIRAQIRETLEASMKPTADAEQSPPEWELKFAQSMNSTGRRLAHFIAQGENGDLNSADKTAIQEMKLLGRMLAVLERLHRSRAAIETAGRQMSASTFELEGFPETNALRPFWQVDRPAMDAELVLLRNEPSMKDFVRALNADVDQLTQVALDVEVRRVDAWIDWASRQPRSRLPSMKLVAVQEAARLESISTNAKSMRLKPDPRLYTLHRNLRRMASMSSTGKWE